MRNPISSVIQLAKAAIKRTTGVDYSLADKVSHSWMGCAVSASAMLAAERLHIDTHWYVLLGVGLGAAVVVGALKELADAFQPATHTVDFWDFVATALGGVPPALVFCWTF